MAVLQHISQSPEFTENEAKLFAHPRVTTGIHQSTTKHPLIQYLVEQGLIARKVSPKLTTQHTYYFDTPEGTLEKLGLTFRCRMHGEDGRVVQGLKSLVETRAIQSRYEGEEEERRFFEDARNWLEGMEDKGRKVVLKQIWFSMHETLYSSKEKNKKVTKGIRSQILRCLNIFDSSAVPPEKTGGITHDLFRNIGAANIKKALTRALIKQLPISQEKLDSYAQELPSDVKQALVDLAPSLKVVGHDTVVRCFYSMFCNGYEYELAVDAGLSQKGRGLISEIEIEVKLRDGQQPPSPEDLVFLKDTVGLFLAKHEIELELREKNQSDIIPASASKGAINALCRRIAKNAERFEGRLGPLKTAPTPDNKARKIIQESLVRCGV